MIYMKKEQNKSIEKKMLFYNILFKGKSGINFAYKAIGVYFYFFKRKEDINIIQKQILRRQKHLTI